MLKLGSSLAALLLSAGLCLADPLPELTIAVGEAPEAGFDPVQGWADLGAPLFQSTLLARNEDLSSRSDLAEAVELSDDGLRWTITLRKGLRFSDGSPLGARDVAYTFLATKAGVNARDMSMMTDAVVLDERRLEIMLSKPWISFADAFYTLGIVPADRHGAGYGRNPLGSGPWRLTHWAEGEQLIAEPNPFYHGKAPNFSKLTLLLGAPELGLAAARAGQVHLAVLPATMADLQVDGFTRLSLPSVDVRGISLPLSMPNEDGSIGHAVTADPAIRQAINLGLDRQSLIEVALNGMGQPAIGPVDALPWSGREVFKTDIEAANAILEASGWLRPEGKPKAPRERNGMKAAFRLNYPASDPVRQAMAEAFALLMRPLGISVEPKGGSWEALDRVLHSEPVLFGFGSLSPDLIYDLFASERQRSGYRNPNSYATEEVDQLLAQAQAAPSLQASYPYWADAQRLAGVEGDNAWAWLATLDHLYLVDDCLQLGPQALQPHGHGWPILATIENWRWTCE